MKSSKVRQVVLPLITALIWGSAFVTQSQMLFFAFLPSTVLNTGTSTM